MQQGFNQNKNKDREQVVGVQQLREQVSGRLDAAYKRLDPANTFARVSGREESIVGGLLFSMLTWTPFMQGLEAAFGGGDAMGGLFDVAADPALCAVFDGAALVIDDKANAHRARKGGLYPKGRRQDGIFEQPRTASKFNLVAANQNYRFAKDAEAEIAVMSEMLDMLDGLETSGVSALRVDPKTALYDTLKDNEKAALNDKVVTRFSTPVRKFA